MNDEESQIGWDHREKRLVSQWLLEDDSTSESSRQWHHFANYKFK